MEDKWISVETRLPEDDNLYLLWMVNDDDSLYDEGFCVGHCDKSPDDHRWYVRSGRHSNERVTHWQPLPSKPTKQ